MSEQDPGHVLAEAQPSIRALQEELAETNQGLVALTVELERARERYQALFEHAVEGIFQTTPEGRYLAVNSALARLYGFDSPEDVLRSLTDIAGQLYVEPGRRAEFLRLLHEQGSVTGFESEIYRKDRSRVWIVENARVVLDPEGAVRCYEGFVTDITARKRAEQTLYESEEKYRTLVEQIPAMTYLAAVEEPRATLYISPQVESRLGFSPSEWTADPALWQRQLYPEDHARVRDEYARSVRGTRPFVSEYRLTARNGTVVWISDMATVVRDTTGGPLFFQGLMVDITERKALEAQVQHTQKMEAVGKLAGGIAHEFNNLLTVIVGHGEMLLQSTEASGPFREGLAHITTAANRAATLTSQLLTFSRKQALQPKVVNLNHVVVALEPMLRPLLGESITLALRLAPNLGLITIDPGQLDQALINLVLNARDAMLSPVHLSGEPRGLGGRLTIETANVMLGDPSLPRRLNARHGPHVRLTVSDTGVGMNAETQRRLFEPFFTTKEVGQGTGLGLAMVEGVITQSGGAIVVSSEPGRGTTFTIDVPHTEGAVAANQVEAPAAAPARGRETILLVEDDDNIRTLVHSVLEADGYTVLEASTPVEALQIGIQHPFTIHLLLTDVMMPGMNGRELSDRLKPVRARMKVLYMSGYTDDIMGQHGVRAADQAFLQKPFTPQALAGTVREVLDRHE